MKNLFKNSVYAAAALVLALGAASCSDSDGDYTFADEREEALRDAANSLFLSDLEKVITSLL